MRTFTNTHTHTHSDARTRPAQNSLQQRAINKSLNRDLLSRVIDCLCEKGRKRADGGLDPAARMGGPFNGNENEND